MTGAAVSIREATVEDADELGRCQLRCWQEAYAEIVEPGRLAALTADVDARIARWRTILSEFPGRLVALDGEQVVGFAAAGPSRDDDLDLLELYSVYVRAAHWGSGLGHRLLHAAIGSDDAFLWVFRDNVRARGFYTRQGFVPDGVEKHDDVFDAAEIRMVRRHGRPITPA